MPVTCDEALVALEPTCINPDDTVAKAVPTIMTQEPNIVNDVPAIIKAGVMVMI